MNQPIATTFDDGQTIEVVLLSYPTSTGLVKVQHPNGHVIVRHKDKLNPSNNEAREFLSGNKNK